MPSAAGSPAPSPDRSHDDRSERRNDGGRDQHRRRRASRSPEGDRDGRGRHHRSRRHRDDASAAPSDDEASARRRGRDRSRERRHRSRSRSRSKHRHRSRSKDAARDRDREESPRHSRRSRHDNHHRSRSRSPKRRKPSTSASPPRKRSNKPLPSQDAAFRGGGGGGEGSGEAGEPVEKQKPNFKQSGLLAKEANTVAGTDIVLKYNEPPDARKPPGRDGWRIYIFKGQDVLRTVELGSRSCWLVGREAAVADLLVEHPSTSKQHAVLQFRHTTRVNEYGDKDARVRPYLIDLESSNGTMLNGKPIETSRYVEVMDKDIIKFGLSEREYVVMLPPA
ncbi:putative fha domain-containing protein snip1 protein [Neofusicoccum parvum UCRNP2]|uniref:Putative fha domain-containing protein snip1 protein n=1 Tax=Botryosphaeria parva (strain UCR-NP2) TaxID=1287680 RepID=R1GMR5_BOTPV|nr:putative fha domain-containing protein snip1 protein [Neofusicoccum parvum UCRNP2]